MYKNDNAKRFINSYNRVDKSLRKIFNFKPSLTYTDVVRKCASLHSVVRRFEDELLDFGRLRNAIVHKSNEQFVIAEPHISIVEQFEKIADCIATPPKAITYAKPAQTLRFDTKIADAIRIMALNNYSNMPVMEQGKIIGVTNNKLIVEAIAQHISGVDEYIASCDIVSTLCGNNSHYLLLDSSVTIDEILQSFYSNRKLLLIILTENGLPGTRIMGVISTGDLLDINKALEDY